GAALRAVRRPPRGAGAVTYRADATLVLLWLAVLVVGVLMVASASFPLDAASRAPAHYVVRHGVYVAGGLLLFAACSFVPLSMWEALHKPLLIVAIALCALVLVPGIGNLVNGSRRW